MLRLNIADAKTHLSRHLERVERGETLILCRRNVPIAEIRPIAQRLKTPRPAGVDAGVYTVPASFFEALPDDLLVAFDGDSPT
jgi:antitoxin (DNA-binding transcriptional repressor) of toxin-antitoxin stability system